MNTRPDASLWVWQPLVVVIAAGIGVAVLADTPRPMWFLGGATAGYALSGST